MGPPHKTIMKPHVMGEQVFWAASLGGWAAEERGLASGFQACSGVLEVTARAGGCVCVLASKLTTLQPDSFHYRYIMKQGAPPEAAIVLLRELDSQLQPCFSSCWVASSSKPHCA